MLDSDFRDLVIPDYTKAEAALSEPAVFRARTQRDLQALAGDPQAMPTTAREFSRTERLLIRVAAYAPGGSATAPVAQLLNRDGKKMSDLVVKPFAPGGEGMSSDRAPARRPARGRVPRPGDDGRRRRRAEAPGRPPRDQLEPADDRPCSIMPVMKTAAETARKARWERETASPR